MLKKYTRKFKEQDEDFDKEEFLDLENKKAQKLIKYLKDNRANNEDARAEFAKTIFELSLSASPVARKFIKKVSMFCSFYDDAHISEDEWAKLNNADE